MYHLVKSIYLHATSQPEYSILLLGLDGAGKTTLHNQIKALYGAPSSTAFSSNPNKQATLAPSSSLSRKPSKPFAPSFSSLTSTSSFEPHRRSSSDPSSSPSSDPVPGASSSAGTTVPTVGQNVSTITLPDSYLKIWDVGGQHALRGLWQGYYARCHAVVFVLDSSDVGDGELTPQGLHVATAESLGRLEEAALVLESILQDADADGVPLLVLANKQDREDCVELVRIKEGFVRRVVEGRTGGHGVRDSRVLACSALTGKGVREAVEWVASRVKWNREARPGVMR